MLALSKCRVSLRGKSMEVRTGWTNISLRQRSVPARQGAGFSSSSSSTYNTPTAPLKAPPSLNGTSSKHIPWKEMVSEMQSHLDELRRERQLSESDPPPYPTDIKLSNWLKRIRQNYQKGLFGHDPQDGERIELLESIGGKLVERETSWQTSACATRDISSHRPRIHSRCDP
jgi:hypothetical protein